MSSIPDVIDFGYKLVNLPDDPGMKPYESSRLPADHAWQNAEFLSRSTVDQPYKNIVVNYFRQTPNMELPLHVDGVMTCGYNMILEGAVSPICFEDGEYLYSSGLVNIAKPHYVPAQPEPRVILKISSREKSYLDMMRQLAIHFDDGQEIEYGRFIEVFAAP